MRIVTQRTAWIVGLLIGSFACSNPTSVEPGGDGGGPDGGGQQPGSGPGAPCTPHPLPWLAQGNFWRVAWSRVEIDVGWTSSHGDYDAGSYTIELGPSTLVDGKRMHELRISGDVDHYAPLWARLGTDGCGDVYGQTRSIDTPVLVYSETSDDWSGTGFWTDFTPFEDVTVERGSTMTPSQFTNRLPYYEPPLSAVGHSESNTSYDPGGCQYFPGYGTICTEASSGPVSGTHFFEYWDADVGPVGMHYVEDYEDCLGTACEARHKEHRVEVWFFGDATGKPIAFESEPDTYADPTPFPVSEELLTMFGAIGAYDTPSGFLPGYSAASGMELAAQVHDWFAFEITPELSSLDVDFYLAWNDDVDLGFYLFTAPDNPTHGFLYLAAATPFSFEDFSHAAFFSGTYEPGRYLLGVRRETASDVETGYGIFSIAGEPVAGPPTIALNRTALSFDAEQGGASPLRQIVTVTNGGGGTLSDLAASVRYMPGQPTGWLSATLSGTATPGVLLNVRPATGTLPAGTYNAMVLVTSPVAANSPATVAVTFTVRAVAAPPSISVSVAQRNFTATAGGTDPAAQQAQVGNAGGGSLTGLQVTESPPASWLTVSLSGTTAPATLTFAVTAGSLEPGTYSTTVQVSSPVASNSPQSVAVTFTVQPQPNPPSTLRIINDLPGQVVGPNDWGRLNTVVRVRVGPTQSSVINLDSGARELLYPADFTSDVANTIAIPTGSEMTLDVSSQTGPYWLFIQTGWWDHFTQTGLWDKRLAEVVGCDGVSTVYKWTTLRIVEPFGDPEVIRLSEWLPIGNWYGSPFC